MTAHADPKAAADAAPAQSRFQRAPEAMGEERPPGAPDPSGGEPSAPRKRFARWRAPVAIGVVILALLVGQVVAFAVLFAGGGDDASDTLGAVAFVIADLVVLGIIILFARRGAERLTPATFGIRRTRFWRAVGWTLAIWVGITALEGLYALLVGGFSNVEEDPGITSTEMIFILFAVAVVTPIVEELAFRGYLFPALTRWKGPWLGALFTAILFGFAHVLSSPIEAVPALAIFGFGACLLYWFTGSLLPSIALHAANNALVLSVGGDWTWQVPVALFACVTLSVLVMLPFARERAPQGAA